MDWTAQFDGYCERTDLSYWSEPLNALTNAAFLIAALVMWQRSRGVAPARLLCAILFVIGIGSFLFHTHATAWAAFVDVAPIAAFILVYLHLVHRDVLGLRGWRAFAATACFFPYAALVIAVAQTLPFFRISSAYWTVPILLFLYPIFLRRRRSGVARGMVIGGAMLTLSITLRSLDETLCPVWPVGTHIFWHVLNAVMLGWMIEVYRRVRADQASSSASQ